MNEYQQDRTSAAVWPWQARRRAAEQPPAPVSTRKQAIIQASVGGVIGCLFLFVLRKHVMAYVVWSITGTILFCGLFVPAAFLAIERGMKAFGRGVGLFTTWLFLVPFFYVVFTLARLIQAACRKDPLHRRFPAEDASFWISRPAGRGKASYAKQY